MSKIVIKCQQEIDESGHAECFTPDVFYVAKAAEAKDISHLTHHGLPKIGTKVRPGMILIGKIGTKKESAILSKMNKIEYYALQEQEKSDELRNYWQQRLYDGSVYAPTGCLGTVSAAYFEIDGKQRTYQKYEQAFGTAIVEIET